MSYCDTPDDFDIDLFMQAMGYDEGYLGKDFMEEHRIAEDVCLWSDRECTLIRRNGNQMTIEMTEPYHDRAAWHDISTGRAELIKENAPAPETPDGGQYGSIELRYRLPWPTTFNEAYDSFNKLGWFGKMPASRMQLMQMYEWLAAGVVVSTGFGTLELER